MAEEEQGKAQKNGECGQWRVTLIEEGHRYVVRRASDGEEVRPPHCTSVTTFAERLFAEFNGPEALAKMRPAAREAKYGKQTDSQILALWEHKKLRAATLGTAMHEYIEGYLRGIMAGKARDELPPEPAPEEDEKDATSPSGVSSGSIVRREAVAAFAETLWRRGLVPVDVEKCIYDDELQLAGTVDAIFREEETGAIHIFDWKRRPEYSRSSPFPGGRRGAPTEGLSNCHHSKALVQLNLYRGILLRAGVCGAEALHIVTIHPDLPGGFREDDVPVDDKLFASLVAFRLSELRDLS